MSASNPMHPATPRPAPWPFPARLPGADLPPDPRRQPAPRQPLPATPAPF